MYNSYEDQRIMGVINMQIEVEKLIEAWKGWHDEQRSV